jgi:molybdopterin converting factor small subunit
MEKILSEQKTTNDELAAKNRTLTAQIAQHVMINNNNAQRIAELTATLQDAVVTLDRVKIDIETKQRPLEEQVITLTKKLIESERGNNNVRAAMDQLNANYQSKFKELCMELEKSISDRETLAKQLSMIVGPSREVRDHTPSKERIPQ